MRNAVLGSLVILGAGCVGLACAGDGPPISDGSSVADSGSVSGGDTSGTGSDTGSSATDSGGAVVPSEMLKKLAGSYSGSVVLATGEGAQYLQQGSSYDFTISQSGEVQILATLQGTLGYLWDGVNDRVETAGDITVVMIEDIGGKSITLSWRAADGLFKVSGAFSHPQGVWTMSSITKK